MIRSVSQPPSNSLFVSVTDYTALLFCFDSTCHSYYGTLRLLKVGGRGIYTDYVIVSKETSLGIAALEHSIRTLSRDSLGVSVAPIPSAHVTKSGACPLLLTRRFCIQTVL